MFTYRKRKTYSPAETNGVLESPEFLVIPKHIMCLYNIHTGPQEPNQTCSINCLIHFRSHRSIQNWAWKSAFSFYGPNTWKYLQHILKISTFITPGTIQDNDPKALCLSLLLFHLRLKLNWNPTCDVSPQSLKVPRIYFVKHTTSWIELNWEI